MLTRRSAIGGIVAATAIQAFAPLSGATGASPSIKAPRLRPGDTVGLVAPAGFVADRFGLDQVMETVRAMGLVPKPAFNLLDRHGYLAGRDEVRAEALQAMYEDDAVRAVFAVRGGWGCQRLLPHLDLGAIAAKPRLLIGSSDMTALHLALAAHNGCPTIHGPNVAHSWPVAAWESFHNLAFAAGTPTYAMPQPLDDRLAQSHWRLRTFRSGKARGRLLGGNLSVLSAMAGTPFLPDFTGAILFLEDTNEAEYRIDRMMTQLAQSGILGRVAGVVFGQCTNCANPGSPYGNFTIYEVLEHHLVPLGVPAFQGASFGHIAANLSLPVGVRAEIDAGKGTIRMLESAVL